MAFRPSLRSSRSTEQVEPNLFPLMNLMVVLIPLLLSTATFVRIGVIELDLPPAAAVAGGEEALPKEVEQTLDLSVTITDEGFYISSSLAILRSGPEGGPSIPKIVAADGSSQYDYAQLSEKLYEIKSRAQGQFPDANHIIVQAEPSIRYQVLVYTMDAARSIRRDERVYSLFPDVSLSAGVL
jgi:biopolymer transport protein ExbD